MKQETQNAMREYNSWLAAFPGAIDGAAYQATQQISSRRELAELLTAVVAQTEPKFQTYAVKHIIENFETRNELE